MSTEEEVERAYLEHKENSGLNGYEERGAWNKRKLGLMAERLFLDPIGYGNELKYGYLAKGGVRKTPAWSGTSF